MEINCNREDLQSQMKTKEAIIIFTRIPRAGKTKTRLMPCYTGLECAKLHGYFLKDIVKACEQTGSDIHVYYEPCGNLNVLQDIMGINKTFTPQKGEDIGERMNTAIANVLASGYESCVLIGADIPEIQTVHLRQAFANLANHDVVLGPTMDGGYYLIGTKKPVPEAFAKIHYGESKVVDETKKQLETHGHSVRMVATLSDIDTPQDVRNLRARYGEKREINPRRMKSSTEKFLEANPKISVIVPMYNEASTIGKMQQELEKLKGCEIILVDGGSTDGTLDMIDPKYRVVQSEKGRANQMNTGAKASGGDILFFLHCDSELPKTSIQEIRRAMKTHNWGCFGISFQSEEILMRICSFMSNFRVVTRKTVFGDQGIFVARKLFFQAGMFPTIPIMEDYQFSLTMMELEEKIGMTRSRISTSPRRFQGSPMEKISLMWKMNRMRDMYRKGVSPEKLVEIYRDIR